MPHFDSLSVNQLVIKTKDGQTAMILGTSVSTSLPHIELHDGTSGTHRLTIEIDQCGPLVAVLHPNGNCAANIRLFDDGRAVCGVYGEDGIKSAAIAIDINGSPMIEIRDSADRVLYHAPDAGHSHAAQDHKPN